jgi:hypothetical protein
MLMLKLTMGESRQRLHSFRPEHRPAARMEAPRNTSMAHFRCEAFFTGVSRQPQHELNPNST